MHVGDKSSCNSARAREIIARRQGQLLRSNRHHPSTSTTSNLLLMFTAARVYKQCINRSSTRLVRSIATDALYPRLREFASELAVTQPCLTVSPARTRVLTQPHEFYSTLLVSTIHLVSSANYNMMQDMIRNARERIFLSSLYIGSSEHELVRVLRSTDRFVRKLIQHRSVP